MKKHLVVYYSKSGNNRYLAEKISRELKCEIVEIQPRINVFFFLILSLLTKISMGNRLLGHSLNEYESIILCGPIWMGSVIPPLRDFINKNKNNIKLLHFVTCCGSTDSGKEDKFGYATVFPKVKNMIGDDRCGIYEAFPVDLIIHGDNNEDIMKARISDDNFTGELHERFDRFIKNII